LIIWQWWLTFLGHSVNAKHAPNHYSHSPVTSLNHSTLFIIYFNRTRITHSLKSQK